MKSIRIPFIAMLTLFACFAYAEQRAIQYYDGYEWEEMPPIMKLGYVNGFISASAYVAAHNLSTLPNDFDRGKAEKVFSSSLAVDKKKKKSFDADEVLQLSLYHAAVDNDILAKYSIMGISAGQIVDGLDSLYRDFRKKQLRINDAIFVVKKQIAGASAEEIEGLLKWLKAPDKYGFYRYTDRAGERQVGYFP